MLTPKEVGAAIQATPLITLPNAVAPTAVTSDPIVTYFA
jgi:hypothetical protein